MNKIRLPRHHCHGAAMPTRFRQRHLQQVVRAARKAGLDVRRVEVNPTTGAIVLYAKDDNSEPLNDFDSWKARHANATQRD
jgi:uncharacterized protein YigE (DUF2233 family)